jgi:hypothetical protein
MDDLPQIKRDAEEARRKYDEGMGELKSMLRDLKREFGYDDEEEAGPELEKAREEEQSALAAYNAAMDKFKREQGARDDDGRLPPPGGRPSPGKPAGSGLPGPGRKPAR